MLVQAKQGSLFWLLDETKTAMGMRLLRSWIHRPLIDKERIIQRQEVVQVFLDHFFERSDLTDSLKVFMTLSVWLVVFLWQNQSQGSLAVGDYLV